MLCQNRLPECGGSFRRAFCSCGLPVLIVLPVADQRRIKGGFVTGHRVVSAKEMPPGVHVLNRLHAHLIFRAINGRQHVREVLKHLYIEDELLIGRHEPSFQPPGSVVHHVAMAHDRTPQRHLRLIGALRIDHVRRVTRAGSIRQAIASGQLTPGKIRFCVFGGAKRRGAGAHINIGRKSPVDHRAAGIKQLDHGNSEKRLCVLLDQARRHGDRRHGAKQGKRCHDHRLAEFC